MAADFNSTSLDETCLFFPREPWKCDTIMIFHRITAAFSIIGCAVVIFMIWLFRRYTVTPQRMILFISIGGLGNAVYAAIGVSSSVAFCKFIASLKTFFGWVMLLWVVAVAVQLYLGIFRGIKSERYEWLYHYCIWPTALIITMLPFFANKYGNSGVWCGIVPDVGWRLGMWYVPLFIVIIVLFILYISIIFKLRFLIGAWERTYTPEVEANKKFLKEEVRPLAFYPFIYLLLYIIPTINRIHNAARPNDPSYELVLLAAITSTALGLTNSLAYGLDKDTRRRLTRDQIKNAWYSHFAPKVTIGEYNTDIPPDLPIPDSGSPTSTEDSRTGGENLAFTTDASLSCTM